MNILLYTKKKDYGVVVLYYSCEVSATETQRKILRTWYKRALRLNLYGRADGRTVIDKFTGKFVGTNLIVFFRKGTNLIGLCGQRIQTMDCMHGTARACCVEE